jgi:hypothetical protein
VPLGAALRLGAERGRCERGCWWKRAAISNLAGEQSGVHTKQPSLERRPARTSDVRALIAAADAVHGIGLARLFALLSHVSLLGPDHRQKP